MASKTAAIPVTLRYGGVQLGAKVSSILLFAIVRHPSRSSRLEQCLQGLHAKALSGQRRPHEQRDAFAHTAHYIYPSEFSKDTRYYSCRVLPCEKKSQAVYATISHPSLADNPLSCVVLASRNVHGGWLGRTDNGIWYTRGS